MKRLLIALAGVALTISASTGLAMTVHRSSPSGSVVKPGIIHGKGSIIQYGSGGITLNSGFNNLDTAQTWDCTDSSGCTIVVTAMVQIGNGGDWAICAAVDGTLINPPCPYQGNLPDSGSNGFVTGNSQQNYTVASGSHTVQTEVYVTNSTSLDNWQTRQALANGQ